MQVNNNCITWKSAGICAFLFHPCCLYISFFKMGEKRFRDQTFSPHLWATQWLYIFILFIDTYCKKTSLHKKPHIDHEKTTVTTCCLSLFEYLNCSPFSSTLYFPNTFPVNIAEGPQGSEYAVNMYRIFQHKLFSLNNKVYYAYVRV